MSHVNPTPVSDEYFLRTRTMVIGRPEFWTRVRYAVFSREDGLLVGVNKAVSFIYENATDVRIAYASQDGAAMQANHVCLIFEGYFGELVNLETTILGYLAYSGAASSMAGLVKAAAGKPVIDMSARHYPWQVIEEVAYAGAIGGAAGTSTRAGFNYVAKWLGDPESLQRQSDHGQPFAVTIHPPESPSREFRLYGSLPHAAAAVLKYQEAVVDPNDGAPLFPSVRAGLLFRQAYPMVPLTLLVDFEGQEEQVIRQAVKVFGHDLAAIRLDTHGARAFEGLREERVDNDEPDKWLEGRGVTVAAARRARQILDELGMNQVQVFLTSGFNEAKTRYFVEICGDAFDAIGSGSWVRFTPFTADIYEVHHNGEWRPASKEGRREDLVFPV